MPDGLERELDAVLLSIASGVPAFAATYWLGRLVGLRYRRLKPWLLAAAYVPGVLVGTFVCYFGATTGQTWLWAFGLSVMGGSLVGLRHGRKRADDERKAALKAERAAAEGAAEGETAE